MMRTNPNLAIANLRTSAEGLRGSFEEFCCHLFRRAPEASEHDRFRRVRGAGGDGGVEATWTFPDGSVWGLQAKFFDKLGASEKAQLTDSLTQATANYPALTLYTICLPFTLTGKKGAKAGKPKQGQHETFSAWVTECQTELTRQGRVVEIDLWDEFDLLRRLVEADPSGGLARYWFGKEALSDTWFAQRLTEAKAQAGQRYSPQLNVATPLDDALQAFGRSELWIKRIKTLRDRFSEQLDHWRRTAGGTADSIGSAPPELATETTALLAAAAPIENDLDLAVDTPGILTAPSFRDAVRASIDQAAALEPRTRAALLEKHGPAADTPGFRQYRAEYQVDFPMAPLDQLRDLTKVLKEVEPLAFQPDGQLPAATAMLLRGEAGIGKTHGIIDAAIRRADLGLRSVVLFGEDVASDPCSSLATKLRLPNDGADSMLDALNAAGEASGYPLVIFIDALNETQPDRRKWQAWLPPLLEQIMPRPFLKLCVSCRDTYLREVIPRGLELPTIIHNGFLGREYEAQFAFFQHYGLGAPAEPLLQDEFSNPLFLRLVCEALQASRAQAVPAGREGIRAIINLLLRAKNERAAGACDYDPRENRVNAAMLRLAGAMAAAGRPQLPLSDARALVDSSPASQSKSLFAVLEGESLIAVVERPPTSFGGEPDFSIRFTFERIGDHLIAEHLLVSAGQIEQAFAPGSALHFLVSGAAAAAAHAGLLEALSIQLPETHRVELIDAATGIDRRFLWAPMLAALPWRNPAFISDRTAALVREALGSDDTIKPTFEAVLTVTARPGHPLNARFLDGLLRAIPMLARDPIWADMLETSYSAWSNTVIAHSGVHRLIDAARRGRLNALPDDVGTLWATTLAWFCASPDRRIRDQATTAMVSIFRARPATLLSLIRKFAENEDEYIAERVLVAAYGALLLNPSTPHLQSAAAQLYALYFAGAQPPLNASLRDHARLIIEFAVDLGVSPPGLRPDRYQPPYASPWPIALPTEEDIKSLAEDRERFPQMQLVQQVGLATGTDFARYVVEPRAVTAFQVKEAGLDKLGIFRWFLRQAAEIGYPGPDDQCAIFDRGLLAEFGAGRGKPGWAERLGKKYYWILLRQLVGQLADHVPRKKDWPGTVAPPANDLQGLDLRDHDPTDLRMFAHEVPKDEPWLTPAPYVFPAPDSPNGDAAWVVENDLPDIASSLVLTDGDRAQWQALQLSASWRGKRLDRKTRTYRYVSRSIGVASCLASDAERVKQAFAGGTLDFDHDPLDYRGYLAEYPRRWPYRHRVGGPPSFAFENADIDFEGVHIRQLRGREWARDYSVIEGEAPSLYMPAPDLISPRDLQWDGLGSWLDPQGLVQIMDPWWRSENGSSLLIRLDYLDDILKQKGHILVIAGFQTKFVAGTSMGPGRLTERTLFIRSGSQTRLIERKLLND